MNKRITSLFPYLALSMMLYDKPSQVEKRIIKKELKSYKCKNPNCDKDAVKGKTHCSAECYKEHYNLK